ncbi:putative FAD-linked oxidoreductase [Neolecta irregularis DAH-3]|uniref:Putative FAD-linked oxidoreductase n=1 Tax=Neolecta irregularis (strain DAH-3) TaxID=1198029 RepID=A0A1U7LK53_NEOID|nr:putative FAD-linked oxidoreductase [Neolecta irregularis DAH-3]|eukprot:OLL22901.1 putative FAD-linked oxidoreductase [Neolecta irregularis DAH-3]
MISAASKVEKVCQVLETIFPSQLHRPGSKPYEAEILRYWSVRNTEQRPACMFMPNTATDVAFVVKLIAGYDVPFAIKSGGHNANIGFASIKDGILIALVKMDKVTYNGDKTAWVGPGGRWDRVCEQLGEFGQTALGTRTGDVGVSGYLLGGGLSFLSGQYGLGADQIIEAEVVLADGRIVFATQYENPDLFFAMKGGGNRLGIFTNFKIKTHPIGLVYAGYVIWDGKYSSQVLSYYHKFVTEVKDPKANAVPFLTKSKTLDQFLMFLFYDGTDPGHVFDDFLSLPCMVSNVKIQKYSDFLYGNNKVTLIPGLGWGTRAATLRPDEDLLQFAHKTWLELSNSVIEKNDTIVCLAIQPLPPTTSRGAEASGLYSLPPDNIIILEIADGWPRAEDTDVIVDHMKSIIDTFEDYKKHKGHHYGYLPLYVNGAWVDQSADVLPMLKGYEIWKKAVAKYDPTGFWKKTGGWKI